MPEPSGQLRLGASQTIDGYLLPDLLAGGARGSGRRPGGHHRQHPSAVPALAHFELDLALIEGENHHPELVSEPWLEDEMLIIAPPTALAGQPEPFAGSPARSGCCANPSQEPRAVRAADPSPAAALACGDRSSTPWRR